MAKESTRFACVADRLFDGHDVRADAAVIVHEDSVESIVSGREVPSGLRVLREPDCTIIPGLIDAHVHFMRWQGPLYLAHGVTTVRDVGNQQEWILGRRAQWRQHLWPRIFCLGPMLDGPQAIWVDLSRACRDVDFAVRAVREVAGAGVDGVKLYAGLPPEWLPAMVAAAHEAGLPVSMHCQRSSVLAASAAGVDEFFHLDGVVDELWPGHPPGWLELWGREEVATAVEKQKELADRIKQSGMVATPTLAYFHSRWKSASPDYPPPGELALLPEEVVRWGNECCARKPDPEAAEAWRRALDAAQAFTGLMRERGVPVLAGTDVPCERIMPGLSLWRELSLLVGSGMSPRQALCAATCEPAARLRMPGVGRLAAGSAADLVFVRGDPTSRIPDMPEMPLVVRSGRVHRPAELIAAAAREVEGIESDPACTAFRRVAGLIGGAAGAVFARGRQ